MRFDKRSRKIRVKKKGGADTRSFWGYLAAGVILLGLFYMVLYLGHEKELRRVRQEKVQEDFDRICGAALLYFQDHGTYPASDPGIAVLIEKVDKPSAPKNPAPGPAGYLVRIPVDPWGNTYVYKGAQRADQITLICWGADGRQGGTGEASDVIRQGCRSAALPLR